MLETSGYAVWRRRRRQIRRRSGQSFSFQGILKVQAMALTFFAAFILNLPCLVMTGRY